MQSKNTILIVVLFISLALCSKLSQKIDEPTMSVAWSQQDLFFYGMLAGGFVSIIGFIAAFLLLCLRTFIPQHFYTTIIQILFALSCGALLGETMLHVLPEAYASRHVKDQNVSLVFIIAIFSFVLLERFMHRLGVSHTHWHSDEEEEVCENHAITEKRQLEGQKNKELKEKVHPKQATGFLNLVGSLLHNFIDGLAIGIAFNMGNPSEFIPITIGIIAHEIPRQMGDVAILLKSRFNERETILSNGIVNLISLVGVYLGLTSHDLSPTTKQYALVFVAGNFMYIASDIWKNLLHHHNILINILQGIGIVGGVYLTLGHNHAH